MYGTNECIQPLFLLFNGSDDKMGVIEVNEDCNKISDTFLKTLVGICE